MASATCAQVDDSWRVWALSCRGGFDFTLLFEEVILGVLPIGISLTAAPFRLRYLLGKKYKVVGTGRLLLKLVFWITLGISQVVLTALWALPQVQKTRASIATNAVTAGGILLLCLLSYAEHIRSASPSFLLDTYLSSSLLFDVARTRTLWLRWVGWDGKAIAIVSSVMVGIKCLLLLLETMDKKSILRPEYQNYPPEATSGFFNKAFFLWLNPLFKKGFSSLMSVDDLFALDKQLESKRLEYTLESNWNMVDGKTKNSLLWASIRAFKWPLLSIVPPRVCLIALNFCQPLLLSRSLSFSTEPVTKHSTNIGYGLIGAYILVYVGIAVSMGRYQHLTYRAITMVRGGLVSMIYKKSSNLSTKDADPASSLTLMSADIERIVQGWQTMNDIWANMAEIGLAIFLLERQLGVACVIPVGVSIFALVGSLIVLSFVMTRQAMWLEAVERRISSTTSMLSSIKGIKMLGLTSTLMKYVHNLRIDELDISKRFRKLLVWNMTFAWLTRIFAPIFTFGIYIAISTAKGNASSLNMSRMYTSLSLFSLLADPLLTLVMALMAFMGAVGSFARIQEFLQKEAHVDSRHKAAPISYNDTTWEPKPPSGFHDSGFVSSSSSSSKSLKNAHSIPLDAIAIRNGTFGWDAREDPVLTNITLTIPRGSFIMLIGPSGCGKSTLLKALLGEIPCQAGCVELLSESVAYCDQTPWHMNGTIQESIIAMSELDEMWYSSVIRACALNADLEQLPRGDKTVIGSKGIALSGGQSQRIALARAVYARRDIVILDDVLSGLDATTENYIFHSLIGSGGLLREIGSTVLLASSSVKRLPFTDHIVVLDHEGKLSEQGNFDDLNSTGGYVSSFSLGLPDLDCKPVKPAPPYASRGQLWSVEEPEDKGGEKSDSSDGDIAIYLYYIRSIGWFSTLVFLVAISAFAFGLSFPSIWVKWWASSNTKDGNKYTGYYLGIYAMLGVIAMISLVISCWQVIIRMVPKSGEKFHRSLLTTVLSAPMLFFSTTDSGSILNRFSQDLQLIDMELPIAAINFVATLVQCIAQMILIGISSTYAAISYPLVIGALYLIQKVYLRTSRQLRLLDIEAKAPLFSNFADCLGGLVTLRAFGWQKLMQERNRRLLDYSQRPFYLLFSAQRWLTLTLDLMVAGIATILIVLVVALRGKIGAGYVGIALLNVIMFSQTIKLLVTFWTNLETHIGSILRIKKFSENVQSEDLPDEDNPVPPTWPSKGQIEFRSSSAAYRPSEPVLNHIDLHIQSGEKVGVCGRTGSGKTSLIMSLFRMVEITSGSIFVDDVDLSKISRQEIRSRINGVSQDPILIQGTVRANADPLGCHTDRKILDALKSVQLLSIVQEKGGLDANVDDLFLSHGQKQLFCLARAMLRPGNILVLDEATSNVDTKTDEVMQRVIREKFSMHTILTVAHKLDTILDYDRVLVLDNGRIIEAGEPYALLSSPDSHFARLYASSTTEE